VEVRVRFEWRRASERGMGGNLGVEEKRKRRKRCEFEVRNGRGDGRREGERKRTPNVRKKGKFSRF